MSIDKLEPVFAEDGTFDADATFATWAGNGYVDERVRYKGLNKVLNRADSRINDIIERGPKTLRKSAARVDVIRNLYTPDNSFSFGISPSNKIDTGDSTKIYYRPAPALINNERKILFNNYDLSSPGEIDVFDVTTMTLETTITGLESGLPTDGGLEAWCTCKVICDDTYAYVLFEDRGAGSVYLDTTRLKAFLLSDWSPHTGWPTAGTAVGGDGKGSSICFANSSHLVVSDGSLTVNNNTDAGLNLIDITDGSIIDSGCGDITGITDGQVSRLCSDGTNIYFIVTDTSTRIVCTATIADLTAGVAVGSWPISITFSPGHAGDIACGGGYICVVSSATITNYVRYSTVDQGIGMTLALSPADDETIDNPGLFNVCYDGFNFWARGLRESGGTTRHAIFKIDLNRACRVGETLLNNDFNIISWFAFDIDSGTTHSTTIGTLEEAYLVSDGRDIWFPGHPADSDDLSGIVYRLPKTALR